VWASGAVTERGQTLSSGYQSRAIGWRIVTKRRHLGWTGVAEIGNGGSIVGVRVRSAAETRLAVSLGQRVRQDGSADRELQPALLGHGICGVGVLQGCGKMASQVSPLEEVGVRRTLHEVQDTMAGVLRESQVTHGNLSSHGA
jgi:hypothetical protein